MICVVCRVMLGLADHADDPRVGRPLRLRLLRPVLVNRSAHLPLALAAPLHLSLWNQTSEHPIVSEEHPVVSDLLASFVARASARSISLTSSAFSMASVSADCFSAAKRSTASSDSSCHRIVMSD